MTAPCLRRRAASPRGQLSGFCSPFILRPLAGRIHGRSRRLNEATGESRIPERPRLSMVDVFGSVVTDPPPVTESFRLRWSRHPPVGAAVVRSRSPHRLPGSPPGVRSCVSEPLAVSFSPKYIFKKTSHEHRVMALGHLECNCSALTNYTISFKE